MMRRLSGKSGLQDQEGLTVAEAVDYDLGEE